MSVPSLILATDLDGTFLGGSAEQRTRLYEWLNQRSDAMLIFVTGRDIDFLRELVEQPGMPRPRYIIGDIGTSVWDGSTFEPVEAIEREIAAQWDGGCEKVAELLDHEPAIRVQPVPFRHRRSYFYHPDTLPADLPGRVNAAGYDCLFSAGLYLDVLPKGISKGPTLLRLLEAAGLPREHVVVAGDTLNDYSLFETGLRGVAVGNAEPALVERIRNLPQTYRSPEPGAAGILDALAHFGHPVPQEQSS